MPFRLVCVRCEGAPIDDFGFFVEDVAEAFVSAMVPDSEKNDIVERVT